MQLLETLSIQNGHIQHIEYHNRRFNESRKELFDGRETLDLGQLINIPIEFQQGQFRCRVLYARAIDSVQVYPYIQKEIKRLTLIDIDNWDYSHKYADRSFMSNLLAENPDFDEVVMVKNGFITDCTIANLAFWDGTNWFTPSTPLLKGTKRQQLLDKQMIMEREIRIEDISQYEGVSLINCFRNLELENLVSI